MGGASVVADQITDNLVAAYRGAAAAPPTASPIEQLSTRERDSLRGIACDASKKEFARELGIAER
jgi:FixJ family two-component response regulator